MNLALLLLSVTASPHADAVTLVKAKYGDLSKAVTSKKDKVILVDFWSMTCVPCRKKFPQIVALHNRYRSQGLHVISVTLDSIDQSESALKFLKQQKATFQNLILDEKPVVWQNKLRIREIPCLFLFDRQGRIERRLSSIDVQELDKIITRLLNEKP